MPATAEKTAKKPTRKSFWKFALRWAVVGIAALWLSAAFMLLLLRWIDPPTTAVQMQRRMQSWTSSKPYHKHYDFVPLSQISPHLQHAVISAEDARFYQHHGFDWHQIQLAYVNDMDGGKIRGASTLTEQLVKNLFFGTERSFVRKGAEVTLVPVAELVLGKQRILELYLNVVEWGPGVYGSDAACRYWYKTPPKNIGKDQAARLAAILPSPLRRKPDRMNDYSDLILTRMKQVGW